MQNGKVIRLEDRAHQKRVFLHILAKDKNGEEYGTLCSFSYAELEAAGITNFENKFLGMECECNPYPERSDFISTL